MEPIDWETEWSDFEASQWYDYLQTAYWRIVSVDR
jgi:hypothetical protein